MTERITYKDAGVDVEKADRLISSLSERIRSTFKPEVLGPMGGFAAMYRLNLEGLKNPTLVTATDGVGTKLKLAFLTGVHDTVGVDLVAMNVNDIVVTSARPLFFLDYFACGVLDEGIMKSVVSGIAEGCLIADCSLIGGETAEMPDFYAPGEYDLAGFCVGLADEAKLITGNEISTGDVIIGLKSSGLHSNGFSLVRKVLLEKAGLTVQSRLEDLEKPLGEELLTPTRIYVKPILALTDQLGVKGVAHITGGGFQGNISRILPEGLCARIRSDSWTPGPIFHIIASEAGLDRDEMYRTFNMGIGLIVVVNPGDSDAAVEILKEAGAEGLIIGSVEPVSKGAEDAVILE
jgi:phosphoribosylformylglycinamidine cyclo-ligase